MIGRAVVCVYETVDTGFIVINVIPVYNEREREARNIAA